MVQITPDDMPTLVRILDRLESLVRKFPGAEELKGALGNARSGNFSDAQNFAIQYCLCYGANPKVTDVIVWIDKLSPMAHGEIEKTPSFLDPILKEIVDKLAKFIERLKP